MMNRCCLVIGLLILSAAFPSAAQDKKKPPPKSEPRVFFSVPLGVAPGKTTKLTLRGSALDNAKDIKFVGSTGSIKILNKGKAGVPDKNPDKVGDTQVEVELTLDAKFASKEIKLIVITPDGETKPHLVLVETEHPVIAEKEANDGFRTAQAITRPSVIEGTIGRAKDVDAFRIEGKKGQSLIAEVFASRHGSPLDASLTLYDAKLQSIAANDDFSPDHRDPRIEVTLPSDGVFYLSLIDANDTGNNLHVYRLLIK